MKVLELAQRHRMAILEDDSEGEFTYEGKPLLPLACGDPTGQVIYMSSLSRLLAPGIRLGFLAAPQALVDRLARVRVRMDWQGDRVLEWSMGDLIRDGDLARHIRKVRRLYRERRDVLVEGLGRHLADCLEFQVPDGGLALWLRARRGFPFQPWLERCRNRGLLLHDGAHFRFSGAELDATRMGFAALEPAELDDALQRMRSAV
jgi:GntR family transcriptional regulator/MocR family aminotransferase